MNEIMIQHQSQLSLIDSLDIQAVTQTMQKIGTFQSIVQQALKQEHDYGIIPGTNKPTLLKPGGEKICMMMGINPEYDFLDKIEDYQKGFFAYNIKCTLKKLDMNVAQGVGSCNSYEKKYRWVNVDTLPDGVDPTTVENVTDKYGRHKYKIPNPNVCDLANTILKMAKKRAFIDAVLQVASLSDVFTQDLEDMKEFLQQEQQVAAENMTLEQAYALKVNFGKYKGQNLKEILEVDKKYFDWLRDNTKDAIIKQGCQIIASALANPQNNQSQAQSQSQPQVNPLNQEDDDLPF
ncbi:hypothetical protein PBV87_00710 [Niameybacter massiliensis]|uniref:Exodeoxyribonuclease X-like C-terminal domain-containing protein n=1 Tax=Holtiella tumoricola TaxID=3018743 RepID=A0AA42DJX1_9FIRM|nr:hypothetical protein [Holtiella tumoricola]MDA3730033.1 hypothetical protein [Holtiella tumoricola]